MGWNHPVPAVLAAMLCSAASAATVTELKPADVAAFVARHEIAIVQVTSPDRKCGYCIGADKKFDRVAAQAGERKFAFARVQHSPWRAMPDWGGLMSVWGVPGHAVFRNGKQIGQVEIYRETPDTFYQKVDVVLAGPAKPVPRTEPKQEPSPLDERETAALRQWVRGDVLKAAMDECGKRFPQGADRYRQAVARWRNGHKAELEQGARLFLQGRGDPKALVGEEMAAIKAWAVNDLGMPMKQLPVAAECDRFAAGLATLR